MLDGRRGQFFYGLSVNIGEFKIDSMSIASSVVFTGGIKKNAFGK